MVRFLLLLFWSIFDSVIRPFLACVSSILCKHRFNFLESNASFTDLSFFTVNITGATERFSSAFCISSNFPDWISLFISFSTKLCKWYGIVLAFFLVDVLVSVVF